MDENLELEMLRKLKQGLVKVARINGVNLNENDFGSYRWKNSKKQEFYLFDYRNNLFETPQKGTSLGTGIEAVRSSAAMIFNLLGQSNLIIDANKYILLEYETEFKAIKDEDDVSHNAHLDATFYSNDKTELHAVEAKMLEWINAPKNLSQAYLKPEMYLEQNLKSAGFIQFFNSLITEKQYADGRFAHRMKRYDAIQMTIHILALYNYICGKQVKPVRKLILHNIVWKYDCDDYGIEEKEAKEFVKKANATFQPLFAELGIYFEVRYETYQDFKKRIDYSSDKKREQYLERYEI